MTKKYNHSQFGSYSSIPELSPYYDIHKKRIQNPKFSFRFMLKIARNWKKEKNIISWRDVASANGEFLYFLCQKLAGCQFYGLDIEENFIKVSRTLLKDWENVKLSHDDILNQKENYEQTEIVSCAGTLHVFPKPDDFLNNLVDMVKPGGLLIVDGCINPFDISMIVQYLDESKEETSDLWRCDFNLHSEKMIKRILLKRNDIKSINFEYPIMDEPIPKIDGAPDINMWTESITDGEFNIVNGMGRKFNPCFLIVEKL